LAEKAGRDPLFVSVVSGLILFFISWSWIRFAHNYGIAAAGLKFDLATAIIFYGLVVLMQYLFVKATVLKFNALSVLYCILVLIFFHASLILI
jgi:hypothetical protein